MQTLIVVSVAAAFMGGAGYFYIVRSQEADVRSRLLATLDACGRSARPDLQLGDLWSIRRSLGTIVDSGLLKYVIIREGTSGEELVSVPFRPKGWPIANKDSLTNASVPITSDDGLHSWEIEGGIEPSQLGSVLHTYGFAYGGLVICLLVIIGTHSWRVNNRLAFDIQAVGESIALINSETKPSNRELNLNTAETANTVRKAQEVGRLLVQSVSAQRELAVRAALGELASQVAHDIRSPLAALEMAARDSEPTEEHRILVRSAVARIRDIANNLIQRNNKARLFGSGTPNQPAQVELLSGLIDRIVSEKRVQFRSRLEIQIDLIFGADSFGHFAKVHAVEFMRVVSNLIDNAVEAIKGKGRVTIQLKEGGNSVILEINDNGSGIPVLARSRLTERGYTYGKEGGSGLGLYHAVSSVRSWGGELEIDSEEGRGTSVRVNLPKAQIPRWFASGLNIPANAYVVVLDDDVSVHQIWSERFDMLARRNQGTSPELVHFPSPEELMTWCGLKEANKPLVFLLDHELIGFKSSGIDLIRSLKISDRSYLITSHSDEVAVREECETLGVRMLPKCLAPFVPIALSAS